MYKLLTDRTNSPLTKVLRSKKHKVANTTIYDLAKFSSWHGLGAWASIVSSLVVAGDSIALPSKEIEIVYLHRPLTWTTVPRRVLIHLKIKDFPMSHTIYFCYRGETGITLGVHCEFPLASCQPSQPYSLTYQSKARPENNKI